MSLMQYSHGSSTSGFYKNSRQGSIPTEAKGKAKKPETSHRSSTNNKIRVCVRVRPLLRHEKMKDEVIYYPASEGELMGIRVADGQHLVESKYDKVYNGGTMQYEIFKFVNESISDVCKGFNSTIFAYGQTGSGKTFTMFGPHWDDN
jgi:hypothetical protein